MVFLNNNNSQIFVRCHKIPCLLFLLIILNNSSFSQEITKISTKEIQQIKNEKGINEALKVVGRDIPVYRIDSLLALDFAYQYTNIDDESLQLSTLTGVGTFCRDEKLNAKLLERLAAYRIGYLSKNGTTPVIPENLFYAIAFQNFPSSKDALRTEFFFWKQQTESRKQTDSTVTDSAKTIMPVIPSEYNTIMIAWVLNKLKDNLFTPEYINSFSSNKKLRIEKIRLKRPHTRRIDTLTLSRSYDSLTSIDFIQEPSFKKIFGPLPASLKYSLTLIYNMKSGIVDFQSWFNWEDAKGNPYKRPYTGQSFKIDLIRPNKAILTWIYGYFG
jgi:hypothetical protein